MALRETPEGQDALAALLAAPPPRRVPAAVRSAAVRQAASVNWLVLGAIFAISAVIAGYFFPRHIDEEWQLSTGIPAQAPGRILAADKTNLSLGGGEHTPGTPVYSYVFDFQPASGHRVQGECYTTGQRWEAGAAVTVRYLPANPAIACIVDARLSDIGPRGVLVLLLPLAVVGIAIQAQITARRTHRLLERGQTAAAAITAITATGTKINEQRVYKITLQCDASLSGSPLKTRLRDPAALAFLQERFKAKSPVYILFDPAKPKYCLLPETF